jgi:hypothetical protein
VFTGETITANLRDAFAFLSVTVVDKVERADRCYVGEESDVLGGMLEFHRSTFLWKCEGLTEVQLKRRSVPPSELSLFELMVHLTGVERFWLQDTFLSDDLVDQQSSPVEVAVTHFLEACEVSRAILEAGSLETVVYSVVFKRDVNLRFIYLHIIEEYARHNGHADLLRESLDGMTGE